MYTKRLCTRSWSHMHKHLYTHTKRKRFWQKSKVYKEPEPPHWLKEPKCPVKYLLTPSGPAAFIHTAQRRWCSSHSVTFSSLQRWAHSCMHVCCGGRRDVVLRDAHCISRSMCAKLSLKNEMQPLFFFPAALICQPIRPCCDLMVQRRQWNTWLVKL